MAPNRCSEKTCAGKRCKNPPFSLGECVSHSICSICHSKNTASKPVIMRCGHAFHTECINESKKYSPNCPNCRMLIFKPKITVDWGTLDPTLYRGVVWSILIDRYDNNTLPESLSVRVQETPTAIELIDLDA